MAAALKVGDKVLVTGQNPPAAGEVAGISTWEAVLGPEYGGPDEPCYLIRFQSMPDEPLWMDASHVKHTEDPC